MPTPSSWPAYLAASQDLDTDDREALDSRVLKEARRRVAAARAQDQALRRCPRCETDKASTEFGKDASRPDGLRSWCRACRSGPPTA